MTRKSAWPPVAVLVSFTAFNVALAGLLTNWFRYSPSLEVVFVLAAQIGSVLLVSVVALIRPVSRRPAIPPLLVAVAVGLGSVMWATKASHGVYFPRWQWNHIVRNQEQSLYLASGKTLTYYLEVRNPFSAHPAVVLVIADDQLVHRIRLPWDDTIDAFASPTDRVQWGGLSDAGTRDARLLLRTFIEPARPRSFLIDLDSADAVELR